MPADIDLLRVFEPVIRFTRGEYFFPVSAERYVERAALWSDNAAGDSVLTATVGSLTLSTLAAHGSHARGTQSSLSGVDTGSTHRQRPIVPAKDRPPSLRGRNRLASVGVAARMIDALNRLSLFFRGSVPGGSAARSLLLQRDHLMPTQPTYYGRVIRDGHWTICQYWFFYCFNNWRSGFGGVNEHEGDWEQVTIYLDNSPGEITDLPEPRWVVFSAHDETGDDLRRRWDDPDLSLVDGRHPVVFAGAGSHSGAYLPGDYLITVPTPTLPGVVRWLRRAARLVTPWSTTAQGGGLAIPYIDYARGDGRAIGPGTGDEWHPVLLDHQQSWATAYRGLWGHDTRDRLGGERGPAGPRYARDGHVRPAWADPVGWSGLAKVAPNPRVEQTIAAAHREHLHTQREDLEAKLATTREALAMAGACLLPGSAAVQALAPAEEAALALRMECTALCDELDDLDDRARRTVPVGPHDHLSHRRMPSAPVTGVRGRVLSWWSVISTPLILCVVVLIMWPQWGMSAPWVAVVSMVALMSVDGALRGHCVAVFVRIVALTAIGLALYWGLAHWRYVIAVPALCAAGVLLVANLREAWRR